MARRSPPEHHGSQTDRALSADASSRRAPPAPAAPAASRPWLSRASAVITPAAEPSPRGANSSKGHAVRERPSSAPAMTNAIHSPADSATTIVLDGGWFIAVSSAAQNASAQASATATSSSCRAERLTRTCSLRIRQTGAAAANVRRDVAPWLPATRRAPGAGRPGRGPESAAAPCANAQTADGHAHG